MKVNRLLEASNQDIVNAQHDYENTPSQEKEEKLSVLRDFMINKVGIKNDKVVDTIMNFGLNNVDS